MTRIITLITILIYLLLVMILVVNIHKKSKVIKYLFSISLIAIFLYILMNNDVMINYILKFIIRLLYYPTFTSCMIILLATIGILLYSLFDDKMNTKIRIFNYIFSSLLLIAYILFMIINIDVTSYNALYNGNCLICIRYISRTFIVWITLITSIKYFSLLLEKKGEV